MQMHRTSDGSSLACKVKLKRLTTVKTKRVVKMTTKASSSSEYFTLNSHDGENVASKRKRSAKPAGRAPVSCAADSEKSNMRGNDGSATGSAKSLRPVRGKRKSVETVKREARKKVVGPEVQSRTETDMSVADQLPPFCSTVQSCDESCSFAAEASDDENDTSSSDVEWEDVEGRIFGL